MWVRRSWWWVVPLLALTQAAVMLNVQPTQTGVPGWVTDWSWMLSVWAGGTLLMSPVAAGVGAFLIMREMPADVRQVTSAQKGHTRPTRDMVVAVWVMGFMVQLAALAVACGVSGGWCGGAGG